MLRSAMLAAYLDASGEEPNAPVASVAGFAASDEAWARFNSAWASFLRQNGLRRFHASHFWAKEGEFKNWSEAKWLLAKGDACRALNASNLFGVGYAVSTQAFAKWRSLQRRYYPADPYCYCLDRTLRRLIIGLSQHPDEGISLYVDQDKSREKLGRELASWHEARLRELPKIGAINPDRPVIAPQYVSSFQCLPLQAADLLANGSFQFLRDYLQTGDRSAVPPFMECIDATKCPIAVVYLQDEEMIDLESRGSFIAGYDA